MNFTMGMPIPEEMILKRYKDEDDETFLELRGVDDYYYRVSDGNRFQYKISKTYMGDERLELLEDRTGQELNFSFSETPTAVHRISDYTDQPTAKTKIPLFDDLLVGDPFESTSGEGSGTLDSPGNLDEESKEKEWKEGESIPAQFRSQCRRNEYNGYTFRHNKFIYLLTKEYKVDIKSPDTSYEYIFDSDNQPDNAAAVDTQQTQTDAEPKVFELEKGDVLPFHFRTQCEEDIGPGAGSRLSIGSFLYFLDSQYRITQKMKISVVEKTDQIPIYLNQKDRINPTFEDKVHILDAQITDTRIPPAPNPSTMTMQLPIMQPALPVKVEVVNLVQAVKFALKKYCINADYFVDTVLIPANLDTLITIHKGDLTNLNDDTREAAANRTVTTLQEHGTDLFKAALIHELYIKSTLSGRGDKMNYFLTHIAAVRPNGTLGSFKDESSKEEKKALLNFFKDRAAIYDDKKDIILKVFRLLRHEIIDDFRELLQKGENIRFDAYFIAMLYKHTTRLERGNGLTMIRLTRAILKFSAKTANGFPSQTDSL